MIPQSYLNLVHIQIAFSKDNIILPKSTTSLESKTTTTQTKRHTRNLAWLEWQSKQRFLKMMMPKDSMSLQNQLEVHKLERILEKHSQISVVLRKKTMMMLIFHFREEMYVDQLIKIKLQRIKIMEIDLKAVVQHLEVSSRILHLAYN